MTTCVLGIDPGCSGALAFIYDSLPNRVDLVDMPVIDKAVAPGALLKEIRDRAPTHAFVERVSAMGTNGSIGNFSLGRAYGALEVALCALGIPWTPIESKVWKKPHKIPGGDEGKVKSRATAQRLFPVNSAMFARVKDHGRADAALIALYGAQQRAASTAA